MMLIFPDSTQLIGFMRHVLGGTMSMRETDTTGESKQRGLCGLKLVDISMQNASDCQKALKYYLIFEMRLKFPISKMVDPLRICSS
jgi:hypothetical protein